ncbi:cedb2872-fd53-481d-ad67-19995e5eb0ca [Sclerotinia trifoliorum]|uniref:Cedb2872-fd53-481d-ad67-19995e5eb0ca n=1 Tax=Sclerotinia trifoliorum TaxID=28548 RepID=A0A8H2W4D1_9HELO|nr:cedb2872-fd53-481d-ad67-19995e5eb0ca [Sclerotinia trifoliorum]
MKNIIIPQPNSPAGWQAYANSEAVASIPLQAAQDVNQTSRIATFRGVFLNATTVLPHSMSRVNVYADVLAFADQTTIVAPNDNGTILIVSRVLTATGPVTLTVPRGLATTCVVSIYASVLNQPITVATGDGSRRINLDQIGTGKVYSGVIVVFNPSGLQVEYQRYYPSTASKDLQASLNTQLRIGLVQFWRNSSIAISLCSHVAQISTGQQAYALLNTQARALGQQLAGQAMAGQNMSYAPVLVLSRYKETTQSALNAAFAFEHQFERFQDKAESLDTQIQAWNAMLSQAINEYNMRINIRNLALEKYEYSVKTATGCHQQFENDVFALELLRIAFQAGLNRWVFEQKLKAVFEILQATITFAVAVGQLCLGSPGGVGQGAAAGRQAIGAVVAAEKLIGQVNKVLSSGTLQTLLDCIEALGTLYPSVDTIVRTIMQFEKNPNINIPSTGDISGTSRGDADAAAIVTMAAWDKWLLEADDQMAFAVGQSIDGASAYQLGLRKHAINGKQLAQAQAEAVKSGYEYVQAQMEVIRSSQNIADLQALKAGFHGQEAVYLEAKSMFYDRAMALRTNVVLSLRNMAWAYRYWALADSSINLDARKSLAEYQQDLSTVIMELERADSRWASDHQPFNYDIASNTLPSNQGQSMINGIKSDNHTASFTLLTDKRFASQFVEGSHYRLNGMDPTLNGILPRPEAMQGGVVVVRLQITTSGIYSDIYKNQVFHFASLPQVRRCSYDLYSNGERGATRDEPIFETVDHAEPTPFTQWKIKLLNPEQVILNGLTGINLKWKGRVRFDERRRLMHGIEEL